MKKLTEETKVEKYLQKVSQCLFDLKEIVNTQRIAPTEEYKRLHRFFRDEKNKLFALIETQLVPLEILNVSSLEGGFLLDNGGSEFVKKQAEETIKYLIMNLDKIQNIRKLKSEIVTGIEEGELKEYLDSLLGKKKNILKNSNEPILKQAGSLNLRESGNICYEKNIIEMRTGLKTLCEIFIKRPNQLVNRDDIYDGLEIDSRKKKSTVAKYVSELNSILKPYFKRKPLVNDKKIGWIFYP